MQKTNKLLKNTKMNDKINNVTGPAIDQWIMATETLFFKNYPSWEDSQVY